MKVSWTVEGEHFHERSSKRFLEGLASEYLQVIFG
jgi:hypothetical protein